MNRLPKISFTRSLVVKVVCVVILLADMLAQPLLSRPVFQPDTIAYYRDLGQRIQISGEIVGEPDIRPEAQNLVVEVAEIVSPVHVPVRGKIMVKASRYPEYHYGDVLKVSCLLETPPVFEKFSYAGLLAKDDIYALCARPYITPGGQGVGTGLENWGLVSLRRSFWKAVFSFKSAMIGRINELFIEPQASLVAGILIGARRAIPQKILDDFNTAGLTHVLAISGYNVSMMITVFGYLFRKAARRRRYSGMLFGVLGLVALTGFSASVLRAAWMGCIALLAQAAGRKGSAVHLLLVSGVIMVLFSPRMILIDLSFQLSFLSTLGILLFMPVIERLEQLLTSRPHFKWISKIPRFMREGFCVTMAAQVFTSPLLFYQFGRFSLIAPVANIFVLPLVPWIMLFGFFALVVSFVLFPAGQMIGFAAYALVTVMLFLVGVFAGVPFAALQF